MVNSGSSALYLAVELLDLPPGSEVITSTLTFSTDISSLVRAGLVPVFVDVEPDTFNADVAQDRGADHAARRARSCCPNLSGNAPDWDAVRAIADRHDLVVVEDSCDALGAHAARHSDRLTLRHQPHQLRQLAHHHVRGERWHGGARRREPARPRPAAAPVGPALRGAALRLAPGRAQLLGRHRRHPLRQHVHLRRARLELRAVGDGRRVRPPAAQEAAGQLRAAPAQLRDVQRVLRAARRPHHPAAPDSRARHRLAVLPDHRAPRRRLHPQRRPAVPRGASRRHPHRVDGQRRCASR